MTIVCYLLYSPVYPEEEAGDENHVDDDQTEELDLEKPDENGIMVLISEPIVFVD